jgi:nitrate reductase gamma subunit
MDAWIDFARGPLFRVALVVCLLGLAYRAGTTVYQIVTSWRAAGDRSLPIRGIVRATLSWVLPFRLLRARPVYSAASVAFHVGIILVPLFSIGHVALWQADLPIWWPTLVPALATWLAVIAAGSLIVLIAIRVGARTARSLTSAHDQIVLLVLLAVTVSGLLAAHPAWCPVDARAMLLAHLLLANLTLVLTPTTKIAHCIVFPFMQLLFEVGWHFPAETGRHVAVALAKEDEKV